MNFCQFHGANQSWTEPSETMSKISNSSIRLLLSGI
jgi:hypothetical protein